MSCKTIEGLPQDQAESGHHAPASSEEKMGGQGGEQAFTSTKVPADRNSSGKHKGARLPRPQSPAVAIRIVECRRRGFDSPRAKLMGGRGEGLFQKNTPEKKCLHVRLFAAIRLF